MGNIKKLFRYLLPILALPYIASLTGIFLSQSYARMGNMAIAGRSIAMTLTGLSGSVLSVLVWTGTVIPALCAESGRVRTARRVHLALFIAYCAVLGFLLLSTLFAPALMSAFGSSADLIDIGRQIYLSYILAAILASCVPCLLGQLLNRYSMIVTLLVCGVGGLLAGLLGMLLRSATGIAAAEGVQFALLRIVPFLAIPLRSFSSQFSPMEPELPRRY